MIAEEVISQQTSIALQKKKSIIILPLKLLIFGYAKIDEKNGLDYYIFKCKKHGRVVDYPHGHDEFLVCSKCHE